MNFARFQLTTRTLLAIAIIITQTCISGCAKKADTRALDAAITKCHKELQKTKREKTHYTKGSTQEKLLTTRELIQYQTLAMLEQKRASILHYIELSYSVNGISYRPPENAELKEKRIHKELLNTAARCTLLREELGQTEGLELDLLKTQLAVLELKQAQLEYTRAAYNFGFPPFVKWEDLEKLKIDVANSARRAETRRVKEIAKSDLLHQEKSR